MAAVPLPVRVERRHEQVGAVQRVESGARSGAVQGGIAQRPGQPLEHGGPDEQVAVVRREPVDDLEGQVVEDVPVAAVEPTRSLGRPLRVADREGRELQSGSPTLGALGQHRRGGRLDRSLADGGQQRRRLVDAEAQLGGAELRQLAAGPEAGQRQRRVRPTRDHHPQRGRQVGEEELDALVDGRRSDEVVVVEDEHVRAVDGGELVEQRRQREVDGLQPGRGQRPQRGGAEPGDVTLQRAQHVGPEPDRIVVRLVEGDPHDAPGLGRVVGPLRQQRRLAPSRRRHHDAQPGPGVGEQRCVQPRPRHRTGTDRRDDLLRRDQRGRSTLRHGGSRLRPGPVSGAVPGVSQLPDVASRRRSATTLPPGWTAAGWCAATPCAAIVAPQPPTGGRVRREVPP